MINRGLEHLSCAGNLREMEMLSLDMRRLWGDHIAALDGDYKKGEDRHFGRTCCKRTSGYKDAETEQVVHWEVMGVPSLEILKVRLDRALSNLI